jgi:C4-dicarboxylate-specific signal transduction histidine kinase
MLVSMDRVQQLLLRMNKEKEQQLVTSAKMAALGTMAGGVAHEINTPLATIGLSSAQLKRLLSQNPVNEALVTDASQRIQSNVTKIAQIIGSLRTISGDAAGAPLQEHPVKALIQQTLDLCTEKFHHAGIELRLTSIQEGLVIRSRAPEIEQVLLNLLNNAFDAIGSASEKWVEITATGKTDSVEIAVIDSGLGIPPSIQEQLFQPFSTTKDIGKGVGLGLSVSKSVIEGHGGTLTYDAGAPHTRFVIRLPV